MTRPSSTQIYAALRYAGTSLGTIGSIAAFIGVLTPDESTTFVADMHLIIDDLVQLFGDVSKFALFLIPIATVWLAKIGFNSVSPKKLIATVQAMPEAQVIVTDPKLASPGVEIKPN